MNENGLVFNYTVAQYKVHYSTCNKTEVENIVDREFDDRGYLEAIVSDLICVKVESSWNYVYLLMDFHNREIVGYSADKKKDASLVEETILSCKYPSNEIKIFHWDKGKEYDNLNIDELLNTFKIKRSFNRKGNPYVDTVSEALNKVLKLSLYTKMDLSI